jgi:hypothetical protein
MLPWVQLAFRSVPGAVDVEVRSCHRVACRLTVRRQHVDTVSWRQLGFWDRRQAAGHPVPLVELKLPIAAPRESMPTTFGECQSRGYGDTRPCPWYGCRHHLGLDERAGKLTLAFPHLEPSRHETCSLVVARHKPRTMEEIAKLLNCSLAYVEKTMRSAAKKYRAAMGDVDLDRLGEGPLADE